MKIPLDFIAGAIKVATIEMRKVISPNTVQSTRQFTVFQHDQELLALPGNLHNEVEAPYCVEFDMIYRNGDIAIQHQRIYQQKEDIPTNS